MICQKMKIIIVVVIKLFLYGVTGFIQLNYFFYFVIVIFFFPHQTWRETISCTIEGMIFVGIFTGTEVSPELQKHNVLVLLKWNWHKLEKKIPAFHHDEIHKLNVIHLQDTTFQITENVSLKEWSESRKKKVFLIIKFLLYPFFNYLVQQHTEVVNKCHNL